MQLEITVSFEGADTVLTVAGEIDLGSVDILSTCLEQAGNEGTGRVVIDLAGVTFLDSSGLNAILRANQSLHSLERELVLRRPTDASRRVLTVAAVDGVLKIED